MAYLSELYRLVIKFFYCVVFAAAVSQHAGAQIAAAEKHIPANGVSTITLEIESYSAITATTRVWDRDEVYVAGVSDNKRFDVTDIRVTVDKDRINIKGHESDVTTLYLTIFIPAKSTLIIKTRGARMRVREPQGTIQVFVFPKVQLFASANIRLMVPETTTIDRQSAKKVIEHDPPTRPDSQNQKPLPQGAPYLTFLDAKATVDIYRLWANNQASQRLLSNAAQAIARRNSLLGKALRQSEPRLRTAGPAKPIDKTSTEEDAEVKLQTQLVVLNTSVTDRDGRAISNLQQGNFKIYEDEVLQPAASFSPEKSPFNLILLIDLSPSVIKKLDLIKEAALHFLDVVGPNDKAAIVAFSSDINVLSHLSSNRQDLRAAVKLMQPPRPGTSFYDALGYTVSEELADVRGERNAIVILSDGEDNAIDMAVRYPTLAFNLGQGSVLTFKQLLDGVLEADVMIYSIHLECECDTFMFNSRILSPQAHAAAVAATEFVRKVKETAREQMKELSTATGGRYFNASHIEDIRGVYNQVAAELQMVYTLSYSPGNQTFNGKFRKIRVVIENGDSANLIAHTRRGYYAK